MQGKYTLIFNSVNDKLVVFFYGLLVCLRESHGLLAVWHLILWSNDKGLSRDINNIVPESQ